MNYPRSHVRGIHAFNPSQISSSQNSQRAKLQGYGQTNRSKLSSKRDQSLGRQLHQRPDHHIQLDQEDEINSSSSMNPNKCKHPLNDSICIHIYVLEIDSRLMSMVTQVSKTDDGNRQGNQFFRKLELNSMLIREKQQQHQQAKQAVPLPIGATTVPVGGNNILGPQFDKNIGKKTLVLDLDQTLVHSSFKPVDNADIILPVDIQGSICYVYVLIRPGAEDFLQRMAPLYEVVIYTASLQKYADPLLDKLDKKSSATYRLFREHCFFYEGVFVKDLSRLGRNLKDVIIVDNSPASYALNPDCALPSISWYDDMNCHELYDMIPILDFLSRVDDVRPFLKKIVKNNQVLYSKSQELLQREARRLSTAQSVDSAQYKHSNLNSTSFKRNNVHQQQNNEFDHQKTHNYQIQLEKHSPHQNREKTRHTSLDAAHRKPLMNTWTPSNLNSGKVPSTTAHHMQTQQVNPMSLTANLNENTNFGGTSKGRPTTSSGSTRSSHNSTLHSSNNSSHSGRGHNSLRQSYNGPSIKQQQPLSQVLQSTNGIPLSEANSSSHHHPHHHPHRISNTAHHQRGSSAHNSRSSSERPKPSTASSSSRKAASNSTHTIRRALQINDIEMKFNGTSPVGGVLTAETAMPSSQLNERKVSTGSSNNSANANMHVGTPHHHHHHQQHQTHHLHHSNTPSTTTSSSGRPLMINLNRPASTRHSSQSSRTKIPGFFQHKAASSSSGGTNVGIQRDSDIRISFNNHHHQHPSLHQFGYSSNSSASHKPSTPKNVKASTGSIANSLGGSASKKANHNHHHHHHHHQHALSTGGSAYQNSNIMNALNRTNGINIGGQQRQNGMDMYLQNASHNNEYNGIGVINMNNGMQGNVVNISPSGGGGAQKYANLLKLNIGDDQQHRTSDGKSNEQKGGNASRHNSLPRNQKQQQQQQQQQGQPKRVKSSTEKLRKSMKLGSPKYGGSGIQIELNPRTTTNTGLFNGLSTTATTGGYHSHHPTSFSSGGGFSGGQFVSPTHHQQTNSLHQMQHQHYPALGNGYGSNFISPQQQGTNRNIQLQKHHHPQFIASTNGIRENPTNANQQNQGSSKKTLIRGTTGGSMNRPGSGKKTGSMSGAIGNSNNNGSSKKGNSGPAGFFGDLFSVRNVQQQQQQQQQQQRQSGGRGGPIMVARVDADKKVRPGQIFASSNGSNNI